MSSSDVQVGGATPAETVDEPGQLAAVFTALGDSTCRSVLRTLRDSAEPLTVQELSELAGVALTSTYRKLDRLTRAGLVEERDGLDPDGHRRSRYRPAVDRIDVKLGSADCPEVTLYSTVNELGIGDL